MKPCHESVETRVTHPDSGMMLSVIHVTSDPPRVQRGSNSTGVLLNLFLNASTSSPSPLPRRTTPDSIPPSRASKCSQEPRLCLCLYRPHPVVHARHRPPLHRTPLWSYLSTTTSTQMEILSGYQKGQPTPPAKSTVHRHCPRYMQAALNHPHLQVCQQVRT